jgi:hypothetical protein
VSRSGDSSGDICPNWVVDPCKGEGLNGIVGDIEAFELPILPFDRVGESCKKDP